MSRMLSFSNCAWSAIQAQARSGAQPRSATLRQIRTLLKQPGLATSLRAKLYRLAAELSVQAEEFPAARRALLKAIQLEPANPLNHYRLGQAFERDPFGCPRRAARRYQLACQFDRHCAKYHAAFGQLAVTLKMPRAGAKALARANQLAPTDAGVLRQVIAGYRTLGQSELATRCLQRARFLAPASAEIRTLWTRTKFDTAWDQQQSQSQPVSRTQRVLPFVRLIHTDGERTPIAPAAVLPYRTPAARLRLRG